MFSLELIRRSLFGGEPSTVDEGIEDVLSVTVDQIIDVSKDAAIEQSVSY